MLNDLVNIGQSHIVIRVYGDLNCPFCFVLHQRLKQLPIPNTYDWRLIEHAPSLNSAANTRQQLEQLALETELAQQRAPDVYLVKPDFCVNTRLATLSYLSVEANHPSLAEAYLNSLYCAYWQQQQDISRYEVLASLLHELKLDWLDPDSYSEQRQRSDQLQWQHGDFDERIPAFHAPDGRVMLGLQNSYNIANFTHGLNQQRPHPDDSCYYAGHHHLALFGITEPTRVQLAQLPDVICQVYTHLPAVIEAVTAGTIDAIAISSAHQAIEHLTYLKEHLPAERPVPVIFIAGMTQQNLEAVAFDLGASDVIAQDSDFSTFRARLNCRINTHMTLTLLHQHAHIDELTGLSNRRSFELYLERAWRHGCRYRMPLSVVIIDCDNFKAYNDTYGHFAGDECLRRLADSLAGQAHRPSDVVARLGGEEFVLLLPGTTAQDALQLAHRARQDISALGLPHSGTNMGIVTISCGVASTTPHADQTPLTLMEAADQALYQAKANGRNHCVQRLLTPPLDRKKSLA